VKVPLTRNQLFVGGEWVGPAGDEIYEAINPANEAVVAAVANPTIADADRAAAAARAAYDEGPWPWLSMAERAAIVGRFCQEFERRRPEFDEAWTLESGATVRHSAGLDEAAAAMMQRLVADAPTMTLAEERHPIDAHVEVRREPIGPTLIISTWNGPGLYLAMKVVPALLAGCPVVLKAAQESALTTELIGQMAEAAQFPPGVFSVLGASTAVSEHLAGHPLIDKVSLTGSTQAGRSVMATCAERVANVTLELGGKSPAIIADDIAMERVLPSFVPGFINFQGQICAALTRLIVPEKRYDEVVDGVSTALSTLRVGDPTEAQVDQGPLASKRQLDRVSHYVDTGVAEGATIALGGKRPDGFERGFYFEPTIFTDVKPGMRIEQEEIFGPVLCVIAASDVDEAITIANGTQYGLAASVYAEDARVATEVASRVRSGTVAVNTAGVSFFAPFGGVKQSGFGRECGPEGLAEFLQFKSIKFES
jgi:acyl-CoA reductase-like NAD-dependent aldehyde dehydrogenase